MALVAPNGWISVDLGWIFVGYIQDGLSVPFGPTEIGSRVLQGGQKWLFSHSRPLGERTIAAVETTNGWISMDIGWIWLGYIQEGLLVPFGPSIIAIMGAWGARIGLKMP